MKLQDNLYSVLSGKSDGEQTYEYSIRLNQEHFIYKAHFPGEPITPGVCIMQIAKELLEDALSKKLSLTSVKNIKFLKIISPAEVDVLRYSFTKVIREDNEVKVQVNVSAGEDLYAKLSLVCQIQ